MHLRQSHWRNTHLCLPGCDNSRRKCQLIASPQAPSYIQNPIGSLHGLPSSAGRCNAVTKSQAALGELTLYGQNNLSGTAKAFVVGFDNIGLDRGRRHQYLLGGQIIGIRVYNAAIDQQTDCLS